MIAEVLKITVPSGSGPSEEATKVADEAAHAPGSEQLLTLIDPSTGEGYVIHLWKDRTSFDAWAGRRNEMIAETESLGTKVNPAQVYEVTYRS